MIALEHPLWLLAIPVWGLALLLLARRQRAALAWIDARVAPRFRGALTRYTPRRIVAHFALLFVAGSLLALAAAAPFTRGTAERLAEERTVLLLLDASLSMGAGDVGETPREAFGSATPREGEEPPANRFEQATAFARDLVAALPEGAFGVLSFSGVPVIHAPPIRDRPALDGMLRTLGYHIDLTATGTRFSTVFEAALHLIQGHPGSYQAVLLSDGELSRPDEFDEGLAVLANLGVPVHAVGFGSREGESRVIYHPQDIREKREEKRIARRYHTSRDDRTLRRMADATGGETLVVEDGAWVDDLLPAIRRVEPQRIQIVERGRRDLAVYPLAAFLACFLLETLGLWRRPRPAVPARPRPATAGLLVLAVLSSALTGCNSRLWKAHRENEQGLALHAERRYPEAAPRFERALAYQVRQQIPLFNLGQNAFAQEDYAAAHELFQQALLVHPEMAVAYYNDGHALYRWGELELDPESCVFERTRELWTQALERFRRAADLAPALGSLAQSARTDARYVEARLRQLDELEELCKGGGGGQQPPPEGEGQQPPPEGEGGQPPPPGEGELPPPEGQGQQPPPEGEGPEGQGDGPGGGGGGSGGQGPAPLSPGELAEIQAALERIRSEAAGAEGYSQSRPQQLSPEMLEAAEDAELWW